MRLRIATFNLESLDERTERGVTFAERIQALRPQLTRLEADVLCLQEVNGQHVPGGGRALTALKALLEGTEYAGYVSTHTGDTSGKPRDVHNMVTLSRFPIKSRRQVKHEFITAPEVRECTAIPSPPNAMPVSWDRPILQTTIDTPAGPLDVLNLHLRAPLSTLIPGQRDSEFRWIGVPGWAEGFFISSIKRNGQALEARVVVDGIFDANPEARVAVCGDLNASEHEVPIATLRARPEDTGNPALANRALTGVEDTIAVERRYTVRHARRPLMLDHILVSRSLWTGFRSATIYNEGLPDEVEDDGKPLPGSFHAPLVAEFDL